MTIDVDAVYEDGVKLRALALKEGQVHVTIEARKRFPKPARRDDPTGWKIKAGFSAPRTPRPIRSRTMTGTSTATLTSDSSIPASCLLPKTTRTTPEG